MSLFDSITKVFRGGFDKRQEDREMFERLQREAELQQRQIFEEEFKKNALEVARIKAVREAAEKSGLQKLRQVNRARRLNESNIVPGSFFAKLSAYTQKNIAKREENLERTEMMRKAAEQLKIERSQEKVINKPEQRRSFGNSTWKM